MVRNDFKMKKLSVMVVLGVLCAALIRSHYASDYHVECDMVSNAMKSTLAISPRSEGEKIWDFPIGCGEQKVGGHFLKHVLDAGETNHAVILIGKIGWGTHDSQYCTLWESESLRKF